MDAIKKIVNITLLYSKRIRESFGSVEYVYGDIYADCVFGALLSVINDKERRRMLIDTAFDRYKKESGAMCSALDRTEIVEKTLQQAEKMGITETVFAVLGVNIEAGIFNRIKMLVEEYAEKVNL